MIVGLVAVQVQRMPLHADTGRRLVVEARLTVEAQPVVEVARGLHLRGHGEDDSILSLLAGSADAGLHQGAADALAALRRRHGEQAHAVGTALGTPPLGIEGHRPDDAILVDRDEDLGVVETAADVRDVLGELGPGVGGHALGELGIGVHGEGGDDVELLVVCVADQQFGHPGRPVVHASLSATPRRGRP